MRPFSLILALLLFAPVQTPSAAPVHHQLDVTIDPRGSALSVVDTITLDEGVEKEFLLHADLDIRLEGPGTLRRLGGVEGAVPLKRYRVIGTDRPFTLRYGGVLRHELRAWSGRRGKVEETTPAEIGDDGVYLSGAGGWYPLFGAKLSSFDMAVRLPPGWRSVSQGDEPAPNRWREEQPQDDLYLLAYPYHFHQATGPFGEARVYLRDDDPALARRYLDATLEYLELYSTLLGPYPYAKFALVENRWESGYGMPSFTLLGPRVMRLPFILRSSYPHEILHNWWGNGVYIDYSRGNWAEGLTAYLADHLLKEQQGRGAEYRRDQLVKYAEYVKSGDDRPLREFRARHNEASQAVGYGKSAMLFHMLRRELGDERFIAGLRRFYDTYRFHRAGFDELRDAFEQASGRDLRAWFAQWLDRPGAPHLALGETRVDGNVLELELRQEQEAAAYRLNIPVALRLEGIDTPWKLNLDMTEKVQRWRLELPARPLRLEVDPTYDLFRRLHPGERPPALATLFGAERLLLVYPQRAPKALREGYRRLAESWAEGDSAVEVVNDRELERLPEDRAVWLLGWENRFLYRVQRRLGQRVGWPGDGVVIDGEPMRGREWSFALATPGVGWLATLDPAALPGLTRKLPHYGKYGYLAFSGDGPTNRVKGEWPAIHSPMTRVLAPGGEEPLPAQEPPALGNDG